MSPYTYFHSVVLPKHDEFVADPTNLPKAMSACIQAYHFIDALALEHGIEPPAMYLQMHSNCPTLEVIRAVCLASKHIVTKSGVRLTDLGVDQGAAFDDGSYYSDGTSHSDAPAVAVLNSTTLPKADILHAVREVVTHLETLI